MLSKNLKVYLEYLDNVYDLPIEKVENKRKAKFIKKRFKLNDLPIHKKYDYYFIFEKEQFVAGIAVNKKPNISVYLKFGLRPKVAISWFFVIKKYRRFGIGRRLFYHVMNSYDGPFCLTTGKKTLDPAKVIYRATGFRIVTKKKGVIFWYKK